MEVDQVVQENSLPPQKSGGFFSTFVVLLATFGIAGGLGYLYWKEQTLQKEISTWQERKERKEQSIEEYTKESSLAELVQAEQILSRAESYRIPWSEIMHDILEIENEFETDEMVFVQFSSDRNKKVTISGRAKSWDLVAQLLEKLKAQNFDYVKVKNAFVTSLNRKETKEKDPYSDTGSTQSRSEFRLLFDYLPKN